MSETKLRRGSLQEGPKVFATRVPAVTLGECSDDFRARGAQVADRIGDSAEEPRTASPSDPEEPSSRWASTAGKAANGSLPGSSFVWSADRMERIGVCLARKGSKVEVTGSPMSYTFWDEKAPEDEIRIEQIEAKTLRLLQLR